MLTRPRLLLVLFLTLAACSDPPGGSAVATSDAADGEVGEDTSSPDAGASDGGLDSSADLDGGEPADTSEPDAGADTPDAPDRDARDSEPEDTADVSDIPDVSDATDAADAADVADMTTDTPDGDDVDPDTPDEPDTAPDVDPDENRPPVAVAGADAVYRLDFSINLDGRASTDPDGDELTYEWDGPGLSFQYADRARARVWANTNAPGRRTVTLTVTDGRGGMATDTLEVFIGTSGWLYTQPTQNRTRNDMAVWESFVVEVGDSRNYLSRVDGTRLATEVSFGEGGQSVLVANDHAWIHNDGELEVHALGDEPSLVWSSDGGFGRDFRIDGGVLVVEDRETGLELWNVSDPSNLAPASSLPLEEGEESIAADISGSLVGHFLNTASGHQFRLYDVSNPAAPTLLDTAETDDSVCCTVLGHGSTFVLNGLGGTKAFVAQDGQLTESGVTLYGAPLRATHRWLDEAGWFVQPPGGGTVQLMLREDEVTPVAAYPLEAARGLVHLAGSVVYRGRDTTGVVRAFADPDVAEVGAYAAAHFVDDHGDFIRVADATGLEILDAGTDGIPRAGGWLAADDSPDNRTIAHGPLVYYWEAGVRLTILDTSAPGDIQILASSTDPPFVTNPPLAASDDHLAVSDGDDLALFDPRSLEPRGVVTTIHPPRSVGLVGDSIYIVGGDEGRGTAWLEVAAAQEPFSASDPAELVYGFSNDERGFTRVGADIWISCPFGADLVPAGTSQVGARHRAYGPLSHDPEHGSLAGQGIAYDTDDLRSLQIRSALTTYQPAGAYHFGAGRHLAITQLGSRLTVWQPPDLQLTGDADEAEPGQTLEFQIVPAPRDGTVECRNQQGSCEIDGGRVRWTAPPSDGSFEFAISLNTDQRQLVVGRRLIHVGR